MILHGWERLAGCRDLPKEWFFDFEIDGTKNPPIQAKRACMECPVRASCYEHAMRYERYGYWALTTRLQRVRIRKSLGKEIESIEGTAYYRGEALLGID